MQSAVFRRAGCGARPGCGARTPSSSRFSGSTFRTLRPVPATQQRARRGLIARASDDPPPSDKKTLRREDEPEEYFMSKAEKKGNPFKDPMAIVGVVGILFPFILLGIAASTGLIDVSAYRGN